MPEASLELAAVKVKMTLSVPRDLRARMSDFKANWSKIAERAFREEIKARTTCKHCGKHQEDVEVAE